MKLVFRISEDGILKQYCIGQQIILCQLAKTFTAEILQDPAVLRGS
jgi:hypothetical protein